MKAEPIESRLLVLYDADCGICSRSARVLRRLDRGRRLRLMPLQSAGGIDGVPAVDVLLDAFHVRDRGGRWSVAGAAWIRIADEIPITRPLSVAGRLPAFRSFVEWAYWHVADNRHRLSRLMGDDVCPIDRSAR